MEILGSTSIKTDIFEIESAAFNELLVFLPIEQNNKS